MLDPHVAGFFRSLAQARLLPRLHVTAVRLLGCETAVTDAGQRTLRMLSQTLRLPVFGTCKPLLKSHSDSAGFNPAFAHILVEAFCTDRTAAVTVARLSMAESYMVVDVWHAAIPWPGGSFPHHR